MMPSAFRRKLLTLVGLLLLNVCGLSAQVSLLPEHTITVDGITLIRDSQNAGRWYYVPERPILFERNPSDKNDPRPVFQLMTYQAGKGSDAYEGGVLQFCVSLNIPEVTRRNLEAALKKRDDMKGLAVSLAPLPFHKADAAIFDGAGKLNAEGTQAPGLAPAYITGALPFQLKLDRFDSDLYTALVNTQGSGVGVLMKLTFEGVLPPAGFKVTIDWDQTYTHLYENKETRIAIGTYNLGVDIGISKTKIREELISKGCMMVESLTSEAVTQEEIDRYLDPVIEKMQQTLIEKIHPPEKIEPENQDKPDSLNKCFFLAKSSVNVVMKSQQSVKKGSETFTFDKAVIVERNTSCGAFIGINSYSDAVKKRLVSTMPLDSWASAFLLLPGVDNNPELHINSVSMSAEVVDKKGKAISGLSDTASWSAQKPLLWLNKDGDETGSLKFPLMSLFKKYDDDIAVIRKECMFKVDVAIEQSFGSPGKINLVKKSYIVPMFDGDLPLPATVDLVDPLVFDVSALTFDNSSGVKKLRIQVKKEGSSDKLEYTFPSKSGDDTSVVFLVESAAGDNEKAAQLMPTLTFETARGKVAWANNGKDLRGLEPSLYFMLFDSDWQKP